MTSTVRKANIKMITNINGEKPNSFLKVLLGDCYKPINLEFSYNSNLAFFEKLISITYKEFLNTEKGDMNLRFFLKKRIDYYKKYERSYFLDYFKNKSNIDFYDFIIKETNEKASLYIESYYSSSSLMKVIDNYALSIALTDIKNHLEKFISELKK